MEISYYKHTSQYAVLMMKKCVESENKFGLCTGLFKHDGFDF